MTARPMLFSAPMVRALLDGRKTQTRRLARWVPAIRADGVRFSNEAYQPGDRLWVKEVWNTFAFSEDGEEAWPTKTIPTADEMAEIREAAYRVDVQAIYRESDRARHWFADQRWRSPIHMPRWASRLTLTVTEVRVQRLQEIGEADAMSEGIEGDTLMGWRCYADSDAQTHWACPRESFRTLWDSLNADRAPWDSNPWVVALTFTVQRWNIDQQELARA